MEKRLALGEHLETNMAKKQKNDKHLCPYCKSNEVVDVNEDRLCAECSEIFGHYFYSEL